MRVLYSAIDQRVPGTDGGSVHVEAVATGLAALGHHVDVIVEPGNDPFPQSPVRWHAMRPPLGLRVLRILRTRHVTTLARQVQPDAIIERYYNFGGEGVIAAGKVGAAVVLEVNAPVIDYPRSTKRLLDRAVVAEPMRRWREWQCARADLLVTPSRVVLPNWLPRHRILEVEWGADTGRFRPQVEGELPFDRAPNDTVVVFAGAFRPWHGAIHLVRAIARLRARGREDIKAVLIGEGPELDRTRREASGLSGICFTGAIPHAKMPAALAAADIGAAPFDAAAHPPLQIEFFWSPLKVFEYMACALPVVCPDLRRLRAIVRHEGEGLLYDPSNPDALAEALIRLADPQYRANLGAAARRRVVENYSWAAHCRTLERALSDVLDSRREIGRGSSGFSPSPDEDRGRACAS